MKEFLNRQICMSLADIAIGSRKCCNNSEVALKRNAQKLFNPFKPNGLFHSYFLEKSILHFRGVRLIFLH